MSKRKLRRRIEKLEDTIAIMRELDRVSGVPSEAFQPLTDEQPWTWKTLNTGVSAFAVRCTCPPNRGDNYAGHCPIHDVQVSYTGSADHA